MIRHFYILTCLLLASSYSMGQKQITRFDNRINRNALNATYRGQINGKLIFSAFSPKTGHELWVSNGSKAGTQLLKDITPGNSDSGTAYFTAIGGQLYFVANNSQLWKTDGTTRGTQMVLRSDSTLSLGMVNDRLLICLRNWTTARIAFAWLDAGGRPEYWNEDATALLLAENKLYYTPYDSLAKKWTLKVFDKQKHEVFSQKGNPLTLIQLEDHKGFEYFSLTESYTQRSFVVANADRSETARGYEWGPGPAPIMLRNAVGDLYLVDDGRHADNNLLLKIYKVVQGHTWETLADIKTSQLYAGTPTDRTEGPFHLNFAIEGDLLAFTTMFGYESIYDSFLSVFDFKKNVKRISAKLPQEVTAREVRVHPKTADVFEIGNGAVKCTYDLSANKPLSIEHTPVPNAMVTVGNKHFELSDNVYTTSGGIKLPLIEPRAIFTEQFVARRDTLNDQLLFWTNDEEAGTGKLWASNGDKTEEILSYKGVIYSWNMAAQPRRIGKSIVFTSVARDGFRVFTTDGTATGSRELYFGQTDTGPYIEKVIGNEHQVLVEAVAGNERKLVVTDLLKTGEIDISRFQFYRIHATSGHIFVLHSALKGNWGYEYVYKVATDGLELVELNKNGDDAVNPQVYDDRIYFILRNSEGYLHDLCYSVLGSPEVHRLHAGAMTNAFVIGAHLVATLPGNEDGVQDVKLFSAATAKPLGSFTRMYPVQLSAGQALALCGPYQVVIAEGNEVKTYNFTETVDNLREVPEGILIKLRSGTTFSWHLFDRRQGRVIPVFKNEAMDFVSAGPDGELLFGGTFEGARQTLWQSREEKRTDLDQDVLVYKILKRSLLLTVQRPDFSRQYIYSLGRNAALKEYAIGYAPDIHFAGNANYMAVSSSGRGTEVARIDKDSLHHFAEIVEGPEGVALQEVFQFKGGVYAIAFTYTKGLQVWKLNERPDYPQPEDEEEINVDTPELPGRVTNLPDPMQMNAYPNPVTHELLIDLKEGGLIKIVDPRGFEILTTAVGKTHKIDMKQLPAGQYIVIYAGPNGNIFRKIVKH